VQSDSINVAKCDAHSAWGEKNLGAGQVVVNSRRALIGHRCSFLPRYF